MIVIASKTGWSEWFIRHELPLSRGYAYFHGSRLLDGERCRWPGRNKGVMAWARRVKDWVRGLKRHKGDD